MGRTAEQSLSQKLAQQSGLGSQMALQLQQVSAAWKSATLITLLVRWWLEHRVPLLPQPANPACLAKLWQLRRFNSPIVQQMSQSDAYRW